MNNHLELKNRIREMRLAKGISQVELAKMANTTQATISSLETGTFAPSTYVALLICSALGTTVKECFYFETEKENKAEANVENV